MPMRRMDAGAEVYVQQTRDREARLWKVGDEVTLRWPGVSGKLRCRVVGIRWWCRGTCIQTQCPLILFPRPQLINGRPKIMLCVTSDALDPWTQPHPHAPRRSPR